MNQVGWDRHDYTKLNKVNTATNNATRNNEKSNFRGIENLEGRTIRHCAHAPLVFWTIDEGKTARMGAALFRRVRPK